jgi:hypothetical protein
VVVLRPLTFCHRRVCANQAPSGFGGV